MNTPPASSLFDCLETNTDHARTFINPFLWFNDCDGYRVIFCRHEILYRVALHDSFHMAFVAVMLRQGELATQIDIATAFGHSVATQRRWETRYAAHGINGLQAKKSPGRPVTFGHSQMAFVIRWFQQGVSNYEMARRLAVSEITIRRALRKAGLRRQSTPPAPLPLHNVAPRPANPPPPAAPSPPAAAAVDLAGADIGSLPADPLPPAAPATPDAPAPVPAAVAVVPAEPLPPQAAPAHSGAVATRNGAE